MITIVGLITLFGLFSLIQVCSVYVILESVASWLNLITTYSFDDILGHETKYSRKFVLAVMVSVLPPLLSLRTLLGTFTVNNK